MIGVFVTNLGRYVEGALCGEWMTLPATTEDVQALLARIGVDGVMYEEIFITDYNCEIAGLTSPFGEYESLDELCYLADLLDGLDKNDLEKFEAAVADGEYTGSVGDLINLAQNLDNYDFYPGICTEEDLGRYLIDEVGTLKIPEKIEMYFDYEAYGRDMAIDMNGTFTDNGYVKNHPGGFIEHYSGRDDLPDEHKIFAYPEPETSIQKTLATYQQRIAEMPVSTNTVGIPAHEERG